MEKSRTMAKKINKKHRKKDARQAPRKKIQHLAFFLFFGVVFIGMPFVYYRSGLDPAIHPRLLFVNAVLIVSLLVFIFSKFKAQINYDVLRNPIFFFAGAYFILTAFSIIFAINPREGNYDINKTFAFLILLILFSFFFVSTKEWHKILPLFFILPVIYLFLVGSTEYRDYVLFATTDRDPSNLPWIYQVRGNMAHKNQFSIALMMILPFIGYGAFRYKELPRVGFIVLILMVLTALYILQTRSVWVGLFIGLSVVSAYLIFYGGNLNIPVRPRKFIGVGMLVIIVGFVSFIYLSEPEDKDSVIYKIKNITNVNEGNNIHRYKTWSLTIDLMKDHFLTGVGAGNWKINSRYYFEDAGFSKEELNWLRPHNDYLWVISEKGIFGAIAFLGLFFWSVTMCIKTLKHSNNINEKVFVLLMLMGLTAYMITSLFTFPLERMNHQVYLALIIASITAVYHQNRASKKLIIKPLLPVLVALFVLSYGIVYAFSVIKMEVKVKEARHYHRTKQWDKLLNISKTIPTTFKTLDAEATPIAWYSGLANSKLENIQAANQAYYEAYLAHPTHVQVINNLGRTYFQLKEYEKARDAFLLSLKILPDYFEPLVNITSTYMELGDYEAAYSYYIRIKGRKSNQDLLRMGKKIRAELKKQGKLPKNKPNKN
jgi:O-antigen ligase